MKAQSIFLAFVFLAVILSQANMFTIAASAPALDDPSIGTIKAISIICCGRHGGARGAAGCGFNSTGDGQQWRPRPRCNDYGRDDGWLHPEKLPIVFVHGFRGFFPQLIGCTQNHHTHDQQMI